MLLFFLCILIPIRPLIGGITLQPYKLFLLIVLPIIMITRSPKTGRFNIIDGLILLLSFWVAVTLLYHHGVSRLPLAIISAIEFFGAYLVGKFLVRDFRDFRTFIRVYLWSLVLLLPFALLENRTGNNIIFDTLRPFVPVNPHVIQIRSGGYRAQSVFTHPIHYGLYASCLFATLFYTYQLGRGRLLAIGTAIISVFCSQTSAAFLSIGVQGLMILWGYVTGGKWRLWISLIVIVYVALELLSNRGPIVLIIETLTLNSRTAWWRVHIWNFGLESVWANPLMGIGLNDWVRPDWLSGTVDNFWLLLAMRYGLPAFLLLVPALLIHVLKIASQKGLDKAQSAMRLGYMISFVGLVLTLSTVHIWGQLHIFIMFYIGAGAVFYSNPTAQGTIRSASDPKSPPQQADPVSDAEMPSQTGQRYTRFPVRSKSSRKPK